MIDSDRIFVGGLLDGAKRDVAIQLRTEMKDDPQWNHGRGKWQWDTYFKYAAQPGTFGTFFNIASFVRLEGYGVEVLQWQGPDNMLHVVWRELTPGGYLPIQVVRTGVHYDLFVPDPVPATSPMRRVRGKRPLPVDEAAGAPKEKIQKFN